jgi:drug/metabolite transporter (DMT)-like permease
VAQKDTPMQRPAAPLMPILVAGLVMIFWGATPVVTKIAVGDMDPLLVALLRTLIAGAVALPIIGVARQPPPKTRRGFILLAISAASGFIIFPILFTIGQRQTSAMHGGLILAALPLFTGSYAALIERRLPSRRWVLGCALALAGEAALIGLRAGSAGAPTSLIGDALVLISALLVATGYVAGARLGQQGYRSLATTFWGVALAALTVAPLFAGLVAVEGWPAASWPAWSAVLFLAVVTSIVGYIGWYWALAAGGIQRIATIQFFQPISGLVLAVILLGEQFTLPLLAASVAIVAGVTIAQKR